jgi:hypothetical protein
MPFPSRRTALSSSSTVTAPKPTRYSPSDRESPVESQSREGSSATFSNGRMR